MKHIGICEYCKKEVTYKYKSWIQKFCSHKCANINNFFGTSEKVTFKCEVCGNVKKITQSEASQRTLKFCSRACANKALFYKGNIVKFNCSVCNKEGVRRSDKMKEKNYCSAECTHKSRMVKNAKWRDKNYIKDYMKKYYKIYAEKWPEKASINTAFRRAQKIKATPAWADKKAIFFVYKLAKMANIIHGIKHEVDHIVPLISDQVCGLHVYENLQVLPQYINKSKSNKHFL